MCLYGFGVWWHAAFAVIDDHGLVDTLLVGKRMDFFIQPDIGRFYPLDGYELNLLSALFGVSASVFYGFNALCVLLVAFCLRYALRVLLDSILEEEGGSLAEGCSLGRLSARPRFFILIDCLVLLLLLCPSFITAWLRLFVPERMEFVFLSVFLACYAFVLRGRGARFTLFALLVLGVACANVALYYKETAFAMLGVFGFVHLALAWRTAPLRVKLFDFLLVLGSAVWLVVYALVVLAHKSGSARYGETPYNQLLVLAKTAFAMVCNEPFLCVLLFALLGYRIYKFLRCKSSSSPLLDASVCAGAVLLLEYIVLRLSSPHYQLPAYIFGLVAIGYVWLCAARFRLARAGVGICALIFVGNSLFVSAYQAAHYKFTPPNFQSTLAFLSDYTHSHPQSRIYLEGVDRVLGVEVYHSFITWLTYYGARDFDIASDTKRDARYGMAEDKSSPYSVFASSQALKPQSGDLLVITPFSADYHGLDSWLKECELLFSADFGYNVPNMGVKSLLKSALISLGLAKGDVLMSQNIYGLPLHFYILRVK